MFLAYIPKKLLILRLHQPANAYDMSKSLIFRLACIVILWLALCWPMLTSQPITLKVILVVIGSGIIIFVPLYKKYFRK